MSTFQSVIRIFRTESPDRHPDTIIRALLTNSLIGQEASLLVDRNGEQRTLRFDGAVVAESITVIQDEAQTLFVKGTDEGFLYCTFDEVVEAFDSGLSSVSCSEITGYFPMNDRYHRVIARAGVEYTGPYASILAVQDEEDLLRVYGITTDVLLDEEGGDVEVICLGSAYTKSEDLLFDVLDEPEDSDKRFRSERFEQEAHEPLVIPDGLLSIRETAYGFRTAESGPVAFLCGESHIEAEPVFSTAGLALGWFVTNHSNSSARCDIYLHGGPGNEFLDVSSTCLEPVMAQVLSTSGHLWIPFMPNSADYTYIDGKGDLQVHERFEDTLLGDGVSIWSRLVAEFDQFVVQEFEVEPGRVIAESQGAAVALEGLAYPDLNPFSVFFLLFPLLSPSDPITSGEFEREKSQRMLERANGRMSFETFDYIGSEEWVLDSGETPGPDVHIVVGHADPLCKEQTALELAANLNCGSGFTSVYIDREHVGHGTGPGGDLYAIDAILRS